LGFAPDPTGGAYSAPPDTLAGIKGPTPKAPTPKGEGRERRGGPRKIVHPEKFLRIGPATLRLMSTKTSCNDDVRKQQDGRRSNVQKSKQIKTVKLGRNVKIT